jgi:hypothetical protein
MQLTVGPAARVAHRPPRTHTADKRRPLISQPTSVLRPQRSHDQAVAGHETQAVRPLARRVLADDSPAGGNIHEQAAALAGVGDIGTAG